MWPTFQQINKEAIQPLDKGEITQSEFFEKAEGPIREFMIKDAKIQIRDVNLFAEISGETYKDTKELSGCSVYHTGSGIHSERASESIHYGIFDLYSVYCN